MKEKHLFIDNGRPHGTVVLNWHDTPEGEFTFFAEAIHDVAKNSVAALRGKPQFGLFGMPMEEYKTYPIVLLYRHALELYMKAVILVGAPMLSIKGRGSIDRQVLLKTHSLAKLRDDLERIFDAYGWEWDLGTPRYRAIDDSRAVIEEFQEVDAGSYSFRYPLDTKGSASLARRFSFNIFAFCDVIDELLRVLEGAAIGAYEELHTGDE